jgi:hypothetical protein
VKTYALYLAACALHLVLLFLFSHLQLYRRHPCFMLWLLAAPLANLAIWVLYWSGEFRLLVPAQIGLDVLWYALLAGALAMAVAEWDDPASAVLRRGIVALIAFALIGRVAGRMHLAGGLGLALANIMNACYLAPTLYMVVKFSGVRLERLPLWLRESAPWLVAARRVWGFTHSLFG